MLPLAAAVLAAVEGVAAVAERVLRRAEERGVAVGERRARRSELLERRRCLRHVECKWSSDLQV
eukprot:1464867-Pleurochrysis_carterae.AAC.2